MIIIIAILVICAILWISLNIVAKKCPTSKLGKILNDWKAKRALSKEQKRLRALEHLKNAPFNHTDASDVGSPNSKNNAIAESGLKISNAANRIYPSTDVDDGNSITANVHPGGIQSADELDGDNFGKNAYGKSRI